MPYILLLTTIYIIKQNCNENTQTYQVEVAFLIWHKILQLIYKEICSS